MNNPYMAALIVFLSVYVAVTLTVYYLNRGR